LQSVIERTELFKPTQYEQKTKNDLKTTFINNRRYLGNKYRLLPFITSVISENCFNVNSVADIFAGTGAVASAFPEKEIITNDTMYSNYISHFAWFHPQKYSRAKIEKIIRNYNNYSEKNNNYMSDNFADTFFDNETCRKIGFIREDIEVRYENGSINEKERALLITSLLYAADKIANTCGHYDAFRQGAIFNKRLELSVPLPVEELNTSNMCYNEDANELVKRLAVDLVYIDPPYNSRQYCDAYHLLENIARWEKPNVIGVARKMDRTFLKSDYCTNKATKAFNDLIQNINAKYILLSYNNMANKGNDRSNAKISDKDIIRILSAKGEVKIFTHGYKPFSAGKSMINEHEERLFLCICHQTKSPLIQSPLNYTGGKFKLLEQLLPHFPKYIDSFVDLFCGGCNVGVNVTADNVIFIDNNKRLFGLYETLKALGSKTVLDMIDNIISEFNLSDSTKNGYAFYNCDSSTGLGSYNREPYIRLKNAFNSKNEDYYYYIMLYVLILYAFNNQIRFNTKSEFNLPVGKRDFNNKMKLKLCAFIDRIQNDRYTFKAMDFRDIDTSSLTENSLVYCDPPYLITCATYNEKNGWNDVNELDLLELLDDFDKRKIKFALSNVLESGGKVNYILYEWLEKNKSKYRTINLNMNYSNSNYHRKKSHTKTREILVVNYNT